MLMMLGAFQSCQLRLEVNASRLAIRECLTHPSQIQDWIFPQQLEPGLPPVLTTGLSYKSQFSGLVITHEVITVNDDCLKLLLSGSVEGFHYWYWGAGWVQSHLEGVSLLPLQLVHSYALFQLRSFLERSDA
ncbi:MAG: hypothetical protein ACO3NK_15050 [Prochlorotrichaceae cyanobacterium]|jgi:hypothetical protein